MTEQRTGPTAPGALLEAVIGMCDDAIFTCGLKGQVSTWGGTGERLFGRAAADVVDAPFDALFATHLRPEVRAVMATVLAGDHVSISRPRWCAPTGCPCPCRCRCARFVTTKTWWSGRS